MHTEESRFSRPGGSDGVSGRKERDTKTESRPKRYFLDVTSYLASRI